MTLPRIAVLVPCYNEEVAIPKVVADFRAALPDATIYVYDNNSRDRTVEAARAAGAVVRRERLQGKGHVVRRMFADIEADLYVLVDGDDTYDAERRPADGADAARRTARHGDGRAHQRGASESYRRGHRFGNALFTGMVRRIFGDRISDMLSGYRVFSRRFVKSFPALSAGFETETEFTVHALELDMPVGEVETPYKERPEGSASKLRTYVDGVAILRAIVILVKEERPLQFFSLAALVLLLFALAFGLPVIVTYSRDRPRAAFPERDPRLRAGADRVPFRGLRPHPRFGGARPQGGAPPRLSRDARPRARLKHLLRDLADQAFQPDEAGIGRARGRADERHLQGDRPRAAIRARRGRKWRRICEPASRKSSSPRRLRRPPPARRGNAAFAAQCARQPIPRERASFSESSSPRIAIVTCDAVRIVLERPDAIAARGGLAQHEREPVLGQRLVDGAGRQRRRERREGEIERAGFHALAQVLAIGLEAQIDARRRARGRASESGASSTVCASAAAMREDAAHRAGLEGGRR